LLHKLGVTHFQGWIQEKYLGGRFSDVPHPDIDAFITPCLNHDEWPLGLHHVCCLLFGGGSLPFNPLQYKDGDNHARDSDSSEKHIRNGRNPVDPGSIRSLSNIHNTWML
jgi:hypothetical protein